MVAREGDPQTGCRRVLAPPMAAFPVWTVLGVSGLEMVETTLESWKPCCAIPSVVAG